MSTSLDQKAKKVYFKLLDAKATAKRRQKAQDERAAQTRAREAQRAALIRENGVHQIDIFNKKKADEAKVKQLTEGRPEDAARGEQQPKTEGSLVGRVIGAIDKAKLEALREAIGTVKSLALECQTSSASCNSIAQYWLGDEGTSGERAMDVQTAAQEGYTAAQTIIAILDPLVSSDIGVKIFRARKGEDQ